MFKQINTKYAIAVLIISAVAAATVVVLFYFSIPQKSVSILPGISPSQNAGKVDDIKKFSSEEEFKNYLQAGQTETGFDLGSARMKAEGFDAIPLAPSAVPGGMGAGGPETPERVSETNVQVAGIDEPDIVKTDGKSVYFSPDIYYYDWSEYYQPKNPTGETKVIKAFPPADLSEDATIDKQGNLLLRDNILMVFNGDKIYGYDVADPQSPKKKWTMDLNGQNYIVGARLYKGKVYLVTASRIDYNHPCPIKPLTIEGQAIEIKCADIYHPIVNTSVDVTYTAIVFDPASGKDENTISFVGNSGASVVYMSENAIYITYTYSESTVKFSKDFFKEKCADIIPSWIIERLDKLEKYDISEAAKLTEFYIILDQFQNSLNDDERLKFQNEMNNRMEDYVKAHQRELEKTGIVRVEVNGLKLAASGSVPGHPLNQFSLDEYNNYLRIATTVGGSWWALGGQQETTNDIYVLNNVLAQSGEILDLGIGESIYSVRFIEDKGYVVTFKQIDPFFVIDLSNPKKPEKKGELKIPGYSSYLHPISKDKILGIGMENWGVKVSLFNVAQPANPSEVAKYSLDEYWTDVSNTHHAFLLDQKHKIFFLPGSKGGYIFSYGDDYLELERAVSGIRAKRAIYINDYLYIIGDDRIVVLDENTWKNVNELEF